jgi:cell division septation protein DedD
MEREAWGDRRLGWIEEFKRPAILSLQRMRKAPVVIGILVLVALAVVLWPLLIREEHVLASVSAPDASPASKRADDDDKNAPPLDIEV